MVEVVSMRRLFPSREGDVRIDRRSKWGNPFKIGRDGSRDDVIAAYRDYIEGHPDLIDELRERNPERLFCWCAPEPCHGDVLKELING